MKAGGNKVDYVGKTQKVFDGIVKNLKSLGADGQVLTAGKSGKVPPGQVSQTGNITEVFQYFYHPDHLGSTSYVTDASGEVYQHLEYFAFGETFVEEHSPYLFNGKELDEETGLYYYGARYYDARTSVFISVDPLADKYPAISAYAYAFNNPLKFIDPTGMEGERVTDPPTEKELNSAKAGDWIGGEGNKALVLDEVTFSGNSNTNTPPQASSIDNDSDIAQNGGNGPSLEDLKKGPPTHPDFKSPKSGDRTVRNPNGRGTGWIDKKKDVWVPTDHDGTHAPHWDRQHPDGTHTNMYPSMPSPQTLKNVLMYGTIAVGVGIIIFDIVTTPSGEGLIGVQMIRMATGGL